MKYLWDSLGLVAALIGATALLSGYAGYVVAKVRGVSPVAGTLIGLVFGPLGLVSIGIYSTTRRALERRRQRKENYI